MNKKLLLEKIKIEDFIWIINFIIVFFALLSNQYEKDFIINNNKVSKNKYKKINIYILIVVFIIYSYFLYSRYQNLLNTNKNSRKQDIYNANLNFIASLLVVIATLIFIYTEINSDNISIDDLSLL